MTPLDRLADLLPLPALRHYAKAMRSAFEARDEIQATLGKAIATRPVDHWLSRLEPADVWCARVMDWDALLAHPGFAELDMVQRISRPLDGIALSTTKAPLRIDGHRATCTRAAPRVGADTAAIRAEFGL